MKRYRWMRACGVGGLLTTVVVALTLPAFGATPAPTISGYAATNPRGVPISSAPPGAPMLIEGQNLGTSGTVAFSGIPAPQTVSWSATEILAIVPTAASYPLQGPVTVTTNGQTASGPDFTITPPPGWPVTAPPMPTPLAMPASPPPALRPGSLDPGFGTAGLVLTDFGGGDDVANAVALQPDGRIVVAGESDATNGRSHFALARYNADGSLDLSFNASGGGLTDFGGNSGANALALQPDGQIVVAGWSGPASGKSEFAVARYNRNGAPDTGFGAAGKVLTDFGGDGAIASALAVQPNGQIVVIGSLNASGMAHFALARYNADGSLDASFGSPGRVLLDLNGGANSVALQPDGKIVVAGDFGLVRLNANGSLDTVFGAAGKMPTNIGGSAVAVEPNGQILVAGTGSDANGNPQFALARYTENGSLDAGFGAGGQVLSDFGSGATAYALALPPDGQIVVAGTGSGANGNPVFALAGYNGSGSLDPSFGAGGKMRTDFGNGDAEVHALAVQPDGQIIAAGWSYSGNGDKEFALARYRGR